MKLSLTINGRDHTLELIRENGLSCLLDGSPFDADVAEIEPGVYSLVIGEGGVGKSFNVRVAQVAGPAEYSVLVDGVEYEVAVRDPRRMARAGRAKAAIEGRQTIKSVMPGKVVRLLVSEGQTVELGQGLAVIEAMKMQNEIKSPKPGRIGKILVREGQAVNAGENLLTVE